MAKLAPIIQAVLERAPGKPFHFSHTSSIMGWKGTAVLVRKSREKLEAFQCKTGRMILYKRKNTARLEQKDQGIQGRHLFLCIQNDSSKHLDFPDGTYFLDVESISNIYKGDGFCFRKLALTVVLEVKKGEAKPSSSEDH